MASGKNEAPCPWCRAPLRTKLETSLARVRRLAAAHAQRSTAPRAMHSGGLIRKTGPHRLLEGEIVLSRSQRQGLTHGQIVKILKSYR